MGGWSGVVGAGHWASPGCEAASGAHGVASALPTNGNMLQEHRGGGLAPPWECLPAFLLDGPCAFCPALPTVWPCSVQSHSALLPLMRYRRLLHSLRLQAALAAFPAGRCVPHNPPPCLPACLLQDVSSTEAAIIYTLEPVLGAGLAYALLGERWNASGWAGASLIIGACLIAQVGGHASALWAGLPWIG